MLKILGRHATEENIELLFSGIFPEPAPVPLWTFTLPYLGLHVLESLILFHSQGVSLWRVKSSGIRHSKIY